MEIRLKIQGNYLVANDEDGKELFYGMASKTEHAISGDELSLTLVAPDTAVYRKNSVTALLTEYKDSAGVDLVGGTINWVRENTGFNAASGGSGASAFKNIKEVPDTTYSISNDDSNKILHFTSATGCVVTIPEGLNIKNRYEGKQMGDGQISFISDGTTTINKSATDTNKTSDQFSVFGLDCTDLDVYILYGKLELI